MLENSGSIQFVAEYQEAAFHLKGVYEQSRDKIVLYTSIVLKSKPYFLRENCWMCATWTICWSGFRRLCLLSSIISTFCNCP